MDTILVTRRLRSCQLKFPSLIPQKLTTKKGKIKEVRNHLFSKLNIGKFHVDIMRI